MDQAAHVDKLYALLPDGPLFRGKDTISLLNALVGDAVRTDAAGLQLLSDFLPDSAATTGAFLDDWARVLGLPGACDSNAWASYTNAQKAAAIRAKLRGRSDPTRANLEDEMQEYLSSVLALVLQGLFPAFAVGIQGVGLGVGSSQWPATWLLEYMPDVLNPVTDDFSAWSASSVTVTDDNAQSPATLQQTAARAVFSGGGTLTGNLTLANAADHEVYFGIWVRASVDGDPKFSIAFNKRSGGQSTPEIFDITTTWVRLEYSAAIGAGGVTPSVVLDCQNAATLYLSWAFAGSRRADVECYAQERAPLNTVGLFGVHGEWSGAQDLLIDDIDSEQLIDDIDFQELFDA